MDIIRRLQYHRTYMKMAHIFASLSQAQRSKVGCLIISPNGQILSQGYNGMPSGMCNCCEYADSSGQLKTKQEVMHAETNAILKCAQNGIATKDSSCYVTLSPCVECAKVIIQAGIKNVYYDEEYRDLSGVDLLRECGVHVEQLNAMPDKKDFHIWHCVQPDNRDAFIYDSEEPDLCGGFYVPATPDGREIYLATSFLNTNILGDRSNNDKPLQISD